MSPHYGLVVAHLPRPAVRRPLSIAVVSLAGILTTVLTPVVAPVLFVVDLVTGHQRGRRVRVWLLVVATIWCEWFGVVRAGLLWVTHLGGRRDPDAYTAANYRLEFWWCARHLANLGRFAGVTVDMPDPSPLAGPRSIIISRHSSHIDAIVPLIVLGRVGRLPRYTLKEDLKWAPAMDLVGDRTPNVWINRAPALGSPMFDEIERLAETMPDDASAVIFPEGTFRTPQRHARAIERLGRTRPDLARRADTLRYVLPPRPAGTQALLRGAPDADLVVLANVGTEHRSSIAEIIDTITEPHPIVVHGTRYERSTVPDDPDAFAEWLIDRWLEMDDWIHQQVVERSATATGPNTAHRQETPTP